MDEDDYDLAVIEFCGDCTERFVNQPHLLRNAWGGLEEAREYFAILRAAACIPCGEKVSAAAERMGVPL